MSNLRLQAAFWRLPHSIISYDPNTDTITATGTTEPDYYAEDYYEARVVCSLSDSNGNYLGSGAATDTWDAGYASVTLEYTGTTPGTQYTLRSLHGFIMGVEDPSYECECYFDDYYDYGFYGGQDVDVDDCFYFLGTGPLVVRHTSAMTLGYTNASLTVPSVDIKFNGNVVTNQTVNVIVGQEINLTTSVQPPGATVTNSQWTVPGTDHDRIANYVVSFTDNQSPSTATVTILPTSLTDSKVDFYWISGGNNRTVQYSVTVNGKAFQPQVTFNVQRPTMASITAATKSSTNIGNDPNQGGMPILQLGNPSATPGIVFTRTVTIPTGFTGTTNWVQVFSHKNGTLAGPNGQTTLHTCGLDGDFPYDLDPDATQTNLKTSDSPGLDLPSGATTGSADYSATMYLIFQPSGTPGKAIWVPLRMVSWTWSAAASFDGSTWHISPTPSDPSNLSDADTTDPPQWGVEADTAQQCSP